MCLIECHKKTGESVYTRCSLAQESSNVSAKKENTLNLPFFNKLTIGVLTQMCNAVTRAVYFL